MYYDILSRSLESLGGIKALRMMLKCAGITFLVLIAWAGFAIWGVNQIEYIPPEAGQQSWLDSMISLMLSVLSIASAWFLFPLLLPAIASLFLDDFLEHIAQEEYKTSLRKVPIREELPKTLLFVLQALAINLVLLPFYFIPLLGQILYYTVNGYFIGREFWVMACDRLQLNQKSLKDRRQHLCLIGAGLVFCVNTPLLNLIMPLLAGASMLHLGFYAKEHQIVSAKQAVTAKKDMQSLQR